MRAFIAGKLRRIADRLDGPGAPQPMPVRFTFENEIGIVFRDDGRGCRLWWHGDADRALARSPARHRPRGCLSESPGAWGMPDPQNGYTRAEVADLEAGILALVPDPLPLRNIPVPAEVTRVEGCTCGGVTFHVAQDRDQPGCAIFSLPPEQAKAAIEAAQDRQAAFTAGLNAKLRAAWGCAR